MPQIVQNLLIFLLMLFPLANSVHASTDPISATSSATATVPSSVSSTSDTEPPTLPILVRPSDGTTTGDNKVEFVWHQSTDPNGNTVTYTVYLNNVATYLGVSGTGNSAGLGYTAHLDGTEIKLKPTLPLTDGEYNWYVKASDNSGNASISTTWHFTIDTTPPLIQLTAIDIYLDLSLNSEEPESFANLSFDIAGPKDVYLTIKSEPWSTLTTKFYTPDDQLVSTVQSTLTSSDIAYPYTHLPVGIYYVSISSYDKGGNTTALPYFTLIITQSRIVIPLPGIPGLPPSYDIPYTPYTVPSLPATVAKIEARLPLAYPYISLLALICIILLAFIWKRKVNLILLNDQGHPLTNIKVYHSIPNTRSRYSPIWMSTREPISYDLTTSDRGRLNISKLGRYSTLTIRSNARTYVLSLSASRRLYTIKLS